MGRVKLRGRQIMGGVTLIGRVRVRGGVKAIGVNYISVGLKCH